jgi:hypothetical protein
MNDKPVRVWQIGPDGTEYYAAFSEEEMKKYYRELCDTEDHCEDDLRDEFEEVTGAGLDIEFNFNDDGQVEKTTWRKLAESFREHLPCQISTGYC